MHGWPSSGGPEVRYQGWPDKAEQRCNRKRSAGDRAGAGRSCDDNSNEPNPECNGAFTIVGFAMIVRTERDDIVDPIWPSLMQGHDVVRLKIDRAIDAAEAGFAAMLAATARTSQHGLTDPGITIKNKPGPLALEGGAASIGISGGLIHEGARHSAANQHMSARR